MPDFQRNSRWLNNRLLAYNRHRMQPVLELRSKTAWWLCFQANRRHESVAELIQRLLDERTDEWERNASDDDLTAFVHTIPYSRAGPASFFRRWILIG